MTVNRKSLALSVDLSGKSDDAAIHASNKAMRELSADAARDGLAVDWSTLEVISGEKTEARNGYGEVQVTASPHTYYVDAVSVEDTDKKDDL